MKRNIIIILAILAAASVIVWYVRTSGKKTGPEWKTTKIEKGNVIVTVTATGNISADTTVQVGAQVSGIVSQIYVDFDSVVKKGQIIAQLDTTLEHATVVQAAAAVENASAQLELQRKSFTRIDTLYQQDVEDKNDYDVAVASLKAAEANLRSAQANYQHELVNIGYATIHAPVNGTVISRNVDIGQTVISSFNAPNLFSIAIDLSRMENLADVGEADIGQVKAGQEARFTVDAYPYDVFKGTVGQIRLQSVMVQNVNNYVVVINVANPERKLIPGLTANTTIKVDEHDSVLRVVNNALHFNPSDDYMKSIHLPDSLVKDTKLYKLGGNEIPKPGTWCYVWIKKGKDLQPVLVKIGLFDGTYFEVSGDIHDGDEIATGIKGMITTAANPTSNNPFMPQMHPQPKK